MPDTHFRLAGDPPLDFKAHDNGDGSFSLAIYDVSPANRGAFTDRSGVTPDAADHTLAPLNAARRYLLIQNNHATQDLWINFDAAAVTSQPSIQVVAGSALIWEGSFIPTGALHGIGAAGTTYTCKEG